MKNFLITLLISVTICFSLNAQIIQQARERSDIGQREMIAPSAKSRFIENRDYLSPSALHSRTAYGDSLLGFNEQKEMDRLLSNNIIGAEYLTSMNFLKRDFINNKYAIGTAAIHNTARSNPGNTNYGGASQRPIGGNNTVNSAPCVNEGFESTPVGQYLGGTTISGWTVSSLTQADGLCWSGTYAAGSPECWVVATPVFGIPGIGTLPNSPLGGTNVIKLHNVMPTGLRTKLVQTFPVTTANTLFQFAYAGLWADGSHSCCTQPALRIAMYDCNGAPLTCSSLSLNATGALCNTGATGYSVTTNAANGTFYWTNWDVRYIDLTPYVGSCVTIEVINADCTATGHFGSLYFDTQCGGQVIGIPPPTTSLSTIISGPVSYCAGSGQAIIAAPLGYASYQWISPLTGTIPAFQGGTAPTLTVTNPAPNSVYTVNLVTGSGCHFTAVDTIKTSQVNIQALGASSTCPGGGAAGSATVVGNGSGTGYTYNWQNSAGVSVGTSSYVSGLVAGVYTITLGGAGVAGCGIATATVQVGVSPTQTTSLLAPFCGNLAAYLAAPLAGSNYQWYHNGTAIQPAVGGNASTYTVSPAVNNSIYWLGYHSSSGCNDSIQFTLIQSISGVLSVPRPATVCPGSSNGTSTIVVSPAAGSPIGQNAYTVTSTGTTAPYSSFANGLTSNTFNPTGFAAGTYSVNAFDGSCKYTTTFTVSTLVFDFTLTPATATLCSGQVATRNMVFATPPLPFQYTYSWTPSTFLSGTTYATNILSPVVAPGVISTIVYTATATSTLASCPVTHTMALTVINPATPHFTVTPFLCDNAAPVSVTVSPPGGSFFSGNSSLIGSNGLINPPQGTLGINTFSYTYAVNQCSVTVDSSFQLVHYNTALLTGTVYPSCVTSGTVDLMAIVQNTATGVWTGPGISGSNGSYAFDPGNPSLNPASLTQSSYTLTYHTTSSPNPTVCPATSTIEVLVNDTITPLISHPTETCSNAPALTLTASIPGGFWSGFGVSSAGVINYGNMTPGSTQVQYAVVVGACTNSASTVVNVNTFNSTAFITTPPDFCSTSSAFNLYSIMGSTTNATWSGPGLAANGSGFFDPAQAPLPGDQYTLSVVAPSTPNNICPSTNSLVLTVHHPTANIVTQPGTQCSASPSIQMVASPATGSWTPTQYLSASGVFSPSLAVIGNNQVQYVVGSSTCNASVSQNINVEAFVSAALSASVLPDVCVTGSPVNLTPFSISGTGGWYGTGVNGISFNPANAGAGSYVLTHMTASSPSGLCPDQATVAITVFSLQTPVLSSIGPLCSSSIPQVIQPTPVGGIFGGINSFAISPQGLFNPGDAIIGNNIINYSVTLGPCVAYAQTTVNVERFVSASVVNYPNPSYCKNDPNALNLNQFVQNPGGMWTGAGVSGSMFTFPNANVGSNIVYYKTQSFPTATLCPDQSSLEIVVIDVPNVSISSNTLSGCAPLSVTLSPHSNVTNGASIMWDMGDGTQDLSNLSPTHTFNTPGTYSVVFTLAGSCIVQAVLDPPITVFAKPTANFSIPDEVYTSDTDVSVTNLSSGNNTYQWKVSNVNYSTDMSPTLTFEPVPASYPITLIVSNGACSDEMTKIITVKNEFNVFIPSSFTPNSDNKNDEFMPKFTPYGLDERSYDFEIFDRWGASLFKTKNYAIGWNGSLQNKGSEPVKEDVYVYKLKYKDLNGNVYNKMGYVTLMK